MKKAMIALLLLSNYAIAQKFTETKKSELITINSPFSYKMLEPNQDLRKVKILFEEKEKGQLADKTLIVGASLISILDYQNSNKDSKFAYLMRHPTSKNQIGKVVSEAVIHSFKMSFTGSVNSWLAAHAEILYYPEQSFGTGTITSLERNQLELRSGFIAIGDLKKFPIYGAIGKMDAPFGQTGSVSPFTNSTLWHAFGGLAYGALAGFEKWNIEASFMAVQGGAQFRSLNTSVGDSSIVPSRINNFTADLNYTIDVANDVSLMFGGSYLYGSAYCQPFPVTHFGMGFERNAAYTYYAKLNLNNDLIVKAGFAKTTKVWPGSHNPYPPLDVFAASKVSSLDIGAKYDFNNAGNIKYALSAEFSNLRAGPSGAPWERQNQIVLGLAGMINNSSKIFVELFRTDGYVPLNFISGSEPNAPFPAGQTHSIRDAFSHGIVLGGQITF